MYRPAITRVRGSVHGISAVKHSLWRRLLLTITRGDKEKSLGELDMYT